MLRRSGLWVPVVVVGAALYWTVAFGLGGLSLALLVGSDELMLVPDPRGTITLEEPISVRLVSADEVPSSDGDETETVEAIRVGLQQDSFEAPQWKCRIPLRHADADGEPTPYGKTSY